MGIGRKSNPSFIRIVVARWLFIAGLMLICFPAWSAAEEKTAPSAPSVDTLQPKSIDEINQLISRLSDEQVRQILIRQLEKSLPHSAQSSQPSGQSGWIHRLESFSILFQQRILALSSYLPNFFSDMAETVQNASGGEGLTALLQMFLWLAVIIGIARVVERFCRRFSAGMRERFDAAPAMQGWLRFGAAVVRTLPELLGIVLFCLISGLLFAVIPFPNKDVWRISFIAAMMVIVSIRLIALLSRLIWSPNSAQLRLAPVPDETAAHLHRNLTRVAGYFAGFYVFMLLLQKFGAPLDGFFLITLVLSLPFMWMLGRFLWRSRTMVANHLRQTAKGPSGEISWLREQMAAGWHILAIGYALIVWLLGIGRLALYGPQKDMAFAISLLIVPIYLILDRAGKWLVAETLGVIPKTVDGDNTRYVNIATGLVRIVIVFTLGLWLFNIWGIDLPWIENVVHAAFSILATLILAHVIWSQTNRYIQRKLESMEPPSEKKEDGKEDKDEEFDAIVRDRSFTLLPMLRKFVGTVLVIMVTMIVLSSLGINIGPLMAGAGVVGLAIGFGSQKLVADVMSGIFYLVDDAFRVGEWIEAGGLNGTVEGFTLRNIMLRHHRGALQIVPFSDLGSVTNYNRGGMVMKFNLDMPYGTNIDVVRKIIKKVNQKIMEDPELGPDLLLPIKSQGIKTIADSVMTFRVKFTAKPGKQFVIQRKALRLITEAMEQKGIQFAHRRVIVELPKELDSASGGAAPEGAPSPERVEQLKAGAAAALTQMLAEEEQQKAALAEQAKK